MLSAARDSARRWAEGGQHDGYEEFSRRIRLGGRGETANSQDFAVKVPLVEQAFLPASNRQVEDIPVLRESIRALPTADKNVCPAGLLPGESGDNQTVAGTGEAPMSASAKANPTKTVAGESVYHARRPSCDTPAAPKPATLPAKEFKTKDGKILPSMEALAKLAGDPKAGAAVFRNEKGPNCVKCHQIGDDGNMIGPPLTVIGGKLSKPQLYEAILYPSAAIEMGYETWVCKTKEGDVFSGLKTEDTPDHITIKDTDGKYHDVDKAKIDRLVKQPISLMPEGLSEAMTQKDLVDLVEYLESLKP